MLNTMALFWSLPAELPLSCLGLSFPTALWQDDFSNDLKKNNQSSNHICGCLYLWEQGKLAQRPSGAFWNGSLLLQTAQLLVVKRPATNVALAEISGTSVLWLSEKSSLNPPDLGCYPKSAVGSLHTHHPAVLMHWQADLIRSIVRVSGFT